MGIDRSMIYFYSVIFSNICAIFELLLAVFFFFQLFKKASVYTSVYYVLLMVGYGFGSFYTFSWLLYDLFGPYFKVFQYIAYSNEHFFLFFLAFWNFIVGLYRCTALGWPTKHERIWAEKQIYTVIIVIIFPFIIYSHSFANVFCIINLYDLNEPCTSEVGKFSNWLLYVNLPISFATVIAVILSVVKNKIFGNEKTKVSKVERRLILQTIITVFFQILYYVFITANEVAFLFEENTSLSISLISLVLCHYSNILVLMIVCHNLRRDILTFYGLKCLLSKRQTSMTTVVNLKSIRIS